MSLVCSALYAAILRADSRIWRKILMVLRRLLLKICDPLIECEYRGVRFKMPFSHTIFLNQKAFPSYDRELGVIGGYIFSHFGRFDALDVGANIGDTMCFCGVESGNYLLIEGEPRYANLIEHNVRANFKNPAKAANLADFGANLAASRVAAAMNGEIAAAKATKAATTWGGGQHTKQTRYVLERCFLGDEERGDYTLKTKDGSGVLQKNEAANLSQDSRDFSGERSAGDSQDSRKTPDSRLDSGDFEPQTGAQTPKIRTLDSVVAEARFAPHFVKIDTDGFDFKVIRGAAGTLRAHHPALFFEWDRFHLANQGEDFLSIFPLLGELGYENALIFDNFGTLLCELKTSDTRNLGLLMDYTRDSSLRICYFDVLLFNSKSPLNIDDYLNFKGAKNAMQNLPKNGTKSLWGASFRAF